jgi:hypothetical protein
MQKLVKDIHDKRGSIQATIIPLNETVLGIAVSLLKKYSDTYNFRSQDSLIAATAIFARTNLAQELVVSTSDRVLKKILDHEKIPVFDPIRDEWT